ncbi:MAG: hypothetical protein M0P69_15115 [Bacteroidales bacterium]|nr:hypothetical protein [Bacteroidales bacterium]
MKKGDRVPIGFQAHYSGQDMKWTETYTGNTVIEAGERLFHRSSGKLKSFYPRATCFSFTPESMRDFIFCLIPRTRITASRYDDDEVRIDLEKYADCVDIYYIGTGTTEPIRDHLGRVVSRKTTLRILPGFEKCR